MKNKLMNSSQRKINKFGDLYNLLLRREAKLVMEIEQYKREGNNAAANDAMEYKMLLKSKRIGMKNRLKGSALVG